MKDDKCINKIDNNQGFFDLLIYESYRQVLQFFSKCKLLNFSFLQL